jgi:hypothetical protein
MPRCPLDKWSSCPYGGGCQEPLNGVTPPYVVVSGAITRSRRTRAQTEKAEVVQQGPNESRSRDLDHDDRMPEGDLEQEEDITHSQSVRPPAYFPPVDLEAWDAQELRKLQIADTFCFSTLKDFTMPGQTGVWGEHRANLSLFKQRAPSNTISEFVMNSNAILCHRTSGGPPCIVVPESLKAFVLRHQHGIPLSGHKGRRKVIHYIRIRYWWKGMNRDVNRWVRACLVCRKRKTPRPHNAGHARSNPLAPYPWHTVSIDSVGPLNITIAGASTC